MVKARASNLRHSSGGQPLPLDVSDEVRDALDGDRAVVALETTVVSHGLPPPHNLDVARSMVQRVRDAGAVPAPIGIVAGRIRVGLSDAELTHFANARGIVKTSRRDLGTLLAQGLDGATTVAATMMCAELAGISVFATGGIGGVHRGAELSFDVSADLYELARTPVAVVCSGAKIILDLPKTLEVLETLGVPVIGLGVERFPAFYVRDSGLALAAHVQTTEDAARVLKRVLSFGQTGALLVNPIPVEHGLELDRVEAWIDAALTQATAQGIHGKGLTPFLLSCIAELSQGETLSANVALLEDNAACAARLAVEFCAV